MRKTLGGTIFIRNALKFDYCFIEAIECLKHFCDKVVVVFIHGDDDTYHEIIEKIYNPRNVQIIKLPSDEWGKHGEKERLSYFTNVAIEVLNTDYNFNLQADEIVHEKSYLAIRKAIETTNHEAFMVSRINLWRSPYTYLNVPQNRLPCSTQIIRLAKTKYRSIDDAESLDAQCVMDFVDDIRIYHMGYVRKREVMKAKVINMQRDVFGMIPDEKLNGNDLFDPDLWFDPQKDLAIINEPLPLIIQDWAAKRVYDDPA